MLPIKGCENAFFMGVTLDFVHKIRKRLRLIRSDEHETAELTQVVASSGSDETTLSTVPSPVAEAPPSPGLDMSSKASERESYLQIRERVVSFLHQQARDGETMSSRVHSIQDKAQNLLQEKRQQRAKLGELVVSTQKALHDIQAFSQAYNEILAIKASIEELLVIEESVRRSLTEIDSVVLNSKILAFNASLEASRAGMEGKGFLVVSDKMSEFSLEIAAIGKTIRGNTQRSKDTLSRVTQALDSGFQSLEKATLESTQLVEQVQKGIHHMDAEFTASLAALEAHAQDITDLQNQVATTVENSSSASATMVGFLQDSQIDQLDPQNVWQRLGEFDRIIDVRRPDEFNAELGHIEGAELITIDDAFAEKMSAFPRDSNYVFVCRSGGRSARAARIALDLGFLQVSNMVGGMLKWKELGLLSVQVESDPPKASTSPR
jgi:hydroxyacylglutathione hydrolase